jgi:hypothetical protein
MTRPASPKYSAFNAAAADEGGPRRCRGHHEAVWATAPTTASATCSDRFPHCRWDSSAYRGVLPRDVDDLRRLASLSTAVHRPALVVGGCDRRAALWVSRAAVGLGIFASVVAIYRGRLAHRSGERFGPLVRLGVFVLAMARPAPTDTAFVTSSTPLAVGFVTTQTESSSSG